MASRDASVWWTQCWSAVCCIKQDHAFKQSVNDPYHSSWRRSDTVPPRLTSNWSDSNASYSSWKRPLVKSVLEMMRFKGLPLDGVWTSTHISGEVSPPSTWFTIRVHQLQRRHSQNKRKKRDLVELAAWQITSEWPQSFRIIKHKLTISQTPELRFPLVSLSSPEADEPCVRGCRVASSSFLNSSTCFAKAFFSTSILLASCSAIFDLRARVAFSNRNWAVCGKRRSNSKKRISYKIIIIEQLFFAVTTPPR